MPTASGAPSSSSWPIPTSVFDRLGAVWPQILDMPGFAREQLEIDASYLGYLDRQDADVAMFRRDEALSLPADLDFDALAAFPPRSGRS